MEPLKQNTARNLMVFLVSSTDHVTGQPGLTLSISISKDGGAFASISPTVTDRGNGWYNVALVAGNTDTLGDLALHISGGSTADPCDLKIPVELDRTGATVASVTGNVAGNVTGNVGGSVNSVTTGVTLAAIVHSGATIPTVTTLTDLTTTANPEPTSVPTSTATLFTKIAWLFMLSRNKMTVTSSSSTVRNNADNATIGSSTISDDGTTFTRGLYG